jgi:hypothetical protein
MAILTKSSDRRSTRVGTSAATGGAALSLWSVVAKTTVAHTLTYFLVGLAAFSLFDYTTGLADPALSSLMRPTDDPLVQAGVLFQPVRGALFGLVFYLLRQVLFVHRRGWLITWFTLAVIGILSTFGPAPGSIEGLIYTKASFDGLWGGGIEVLTQSGLFSALTCYWVKHPEKRWLNWVLGVLVAIALILPALGLVARQLSAA